MLAVIRSSAKVQSVLCLVFGLIVLSFQDSLIKWMSGDYPLHQIVFIRSCLAILLTVYFAHLEGGLRLLRTRRLPLQLARGLLMVSASICYFLALAAMPLADAAAIFFVAPLFITALSVPFLGERVGPRRWAAVAIGFAGALIIIRPVGAALDIGQLLALGSAISFGLYQILTRRAAAIDPPETQILYTALIAAVVMSAIVPFDFVAPRVPLHWILFAALGMIGGVTQYFVIRALQFAPAATVSPYGYGELIGATIIGYALFGDFPDRWTWIGATVIVASGLYVAYREGLHTDRRS